MRPKNGQTLTLDYLLVGNCCPVDDKSKYLKTGPVGCTQI